MLNWVCGIQTCPRPGVDLKKTIDFIQRAGWEKPIIFGEPGTIQTNFTQINWPYRFGDWGGWISALSCLHATHPDVDYFVMFEDDIALCKNIKDYLESFIGNLPDFGTFNLYTPERHHSTFGSTPCVTDESAFGWELWGAQGVVFSKSSLRSFLSSPLILGYRETTIGKSNAHKDSVIGIWGRDTGYRIYYHTPSLVEHLHLNSLIGSEPHRAYQFVGEDFNASQWIEKGPNLSLAKFL